MQSQPDPRHLLLSKEHPPRPGSPQRATVYDPPLPIEHLTSVRDRFACKAPPRDALGVVIKMRNVVTHPTREQPGDFSVYEWAQAGMLARYWLCLSLLNTVGYQGQVAEILKAQPRWTGQLRLVPWASDR
jgi:hypothetical protein